MIDKVLVLSLERCVDRQYAFLGASQMRDIPLASIRFVKAHDDEGYTDMGAVATAAAADGFGFVEEYAIGTVTEHVQQTKASVCQVWNYGRILRHIAERDDVCLLIHDDQMIDVSFNILNIIVNELLDVEGEEFYAFQLSLRGDINEIAPDQGQGIFDIDIVSQQLFGAIFYQAIPSYRDFFLKKGCAGYDETMVLSPEGARWILRCLENAADFYIFYDHFLCKNLTLESAVANQNGKGIYCPKFTGYAFVRQIMAMQTTTDFAPAGTHHYAESQKHTEIEWEEVR